MSASLSASRLVEPIRRSGRTSATSVRLVAATRADYPSVWQFLRDVFGAPSPEEFWASLDDPFHEHHDRLLLKQGSEIVAHAHATRRTMRFGPLDLPVAGLHWLGVAPRCRGRGQGLRLLRSAENRMACQGAMVGLMRTTIPHFFRQTGWALCGYDNRSEADARAILSEMLDRGLRGSRRRQRLKVRLWRRMEMSALARIYRQAVENTNGPLQRTEAYWQWLIRRHAYDQLYVALDGPDLLELEETTTPIVGYAVARGERILELMTAPDDRRAAVELLARACGDAIEQNRHWLTLHGPKENCLHKLFHWAGGRRNLEEPDGGEVLMARLLAPVKLLRRLGPELERRAEAAGLPGRFELGLAVDRKKYLLTREPRGLRVDSGKLGRSYLELNVADFTRLVLGQLDFGEAEAAGCLSASTALARDVGGTLFPRLPLWRPRFDDALA